jgi:hypothetical protein
MTTAGPILPIPPSLDMSRHADTSSAGRSGMGYGHTISPQPTVSIDHSASVPGSTYQSRENYEYIHNSSPHYRSPGQSRASSSDAYLPTPVTSGQPSSYYNAYPTQSQSSPSKFAQQQQQRIFSPAQSADGDWGQVAGPSTYRRPSGARQSPVKRQEYEDERVGTENPCKPSPPQSIGLWD